MYFVNSRKRNSEWLVTDDDNANDDEDDDLEEDDDYKEDTEFNLNLPDGKGFTVYDKSDVMVAVAIGNNQTPVEIGSSNKPLLFPIRHNVKRLRVNSEENRDGENSGINSGAHSSTNSGTDAGKSGKMTILDEFYQEPENGEAGPPERDSDEVIEGSDVKDPENCEAPDDDVIPCCSRTISKREIAAFPKIDDSSDSAKNQLKGLKKENAASKLGLEFYKTKNENSYILHIPCLANFTFHGKLRFTLITGKIEVFGYVVDIESKNKTIEVYSPRRFMQIGIKAVLPFTIPDYSDIESSLKNKAMLPEGELSNVMCNFSPDDTLVLVEKLYSPFSPILHHYFDEVDIYFEKRVLEEGSRLEKDLDCLLNYKSKLYKIKTFTEGCEWKQIKVKRSNLVCGGKGVGKSTLLKYLINRSLSTKEKILCFDLDPGQTEFTPPGFVSAVVVEQPLLGPGFTHITKPIQMAYVGSTNVALDPIRYLKSVSHILQGCRNDPNLSDITWFINTMGFNKDIGLDIMINIIKMFRPDVVVQINSSEKSRNFLICFTANVVEIQPVMQLIPLDEEVLYHDLVKIESSARLRELAIQSGFKPSQVRDLMTLAYFSPLLTFPYFNFNAVRPRWIRLSDVFLAVNESIPPSTILKAFNGSLVALCNLDGIACAERLMFGNGNEVFCKIVIKPEIAPCFGAGIVRAIDVRQKKIYVITDLTDRELLKVNCLSLGNVSPPASIFLKQTFVDEPTVYTDVFEIGNNQKLKRVFNYVPHFNSA